MNCYNGERYLQEALLSVKNQTYKNWELIFWDNLSTDLSRDIFYKFKEGDDRFLYFCAEKFTSLGQARNLAVNQAQSKWLAFIDVDDVWKTYKLERQVERIQNLDGNVGIVYGAADYIIESRDDRNQEKMLAGFKGMKFPKKETGFIFKDLLKRNFIIFSTVLILKRLYKNVGGIEENFKLNEDYSLLLKSSRLAIASRIDEIICTYRIHFNNNTHSLAEDSYIETNEILNSLEFSYEVGLAIKENYTRYAFYKIKNKNIISGLLMFIRYGSIKYIAFKFYSKYYE